MEKAWRNLLQDNDLHKPGPALGVPNNDLHKPGPAPGVPNSKTTTKLTHPKYLLYKDLWLSLKFSYWLCRWIWYNGRKALCDKDLGKLTDKNDAVSLRWGGVVKVTASPFLGKCSSLPTFLPHSGVRHVAREFWSSTGHGSFFRKLKSKIGRGDLSFCLTQYPFVGLYVVISTRVLPFGWQKVESTWVLCFGVLKYINRV